jgi:hypothetical protein
MKRYLVTGYEAFEISLRPTRAAAQTSKVTELCRVSPICDA